MTRVDVLSRQQNACNQKKVTAYEAQYRDEGAPHGLPGHAWASAVVVPDALTLQLEGLNPGSACATLYLDPLFFVCADWCGLVRSPACCLYRSASC